jgi:hypothetical protein
MTTPRFPLIGTALAALFLAIFASPAVARKVIGPPDPIPTWSYNPGGGFGGTNQLIITGTAGDDTIILGTDQPISGYGNITINGLNTGIPLFGNPLDITVYGDPPDGSGRGGDDTIDLSAWTIGSLINDGSGVRSRGQRPCLRWPRRRHADRGQRLSRAAHRIQPRRRARSGPDHGRRW